MDGMTGFNPGEAKEQIEKFYYSGIVACIALYDAYYYDFFDNLYAVWASPKAVEFGIKYAPIMQMSIYSNIEMFKNIARKAGNSYNIIATANGENGIDVDLDIDFLHVNFELNTSLSAERDGIVGMNFMQVKLALAAFEHSIKKYYSQLDGLPLDIAFYDPDGSQKEAYKSLIEKSKKEVTEIVNSVKADIQAAMEEEENTILLAKQKSTEILNG